MDAADCPARKYIEFATPAVVIGITVLKFKVEITCRSKADATTFKKELQHNQTLNKILSVVDKSTQFQRKILLSVHESINSDYINAVLENSYNFKSEEFKILRQQKSRLQRLNNWI